MFCIYILNAKLIPICHLLALLAHHILHVSRIRVKTYVFIVSGTIEPVILTSSSEINDTFEGTEALLSGYGSTSPGKYVVTFNSYSTDKE